LFPKQPISPHCTAHLRHFWLLFQLFGDFGLFVLKFLKLVDGFEEIAPTLRKNFGVVHAAPFPFGGPRELSDGFLVRTVVQ
jgi:hypothetical protein